MNKTSRYRILAIGKIKKKWIQEGLDLYQKRIPDLTIIQLRDSNPQREAQSIYSALRKDEDLIVLTEEGERLSSIDLSHRLQNAGSKRLAFAIGGEDGLTPDIKKSAKWMLSLSPLTFPHEIARLLLLEQLYRARTIHSGGPYHRR